LSAVVPDLVVVLRHSATQSLACDKLKNLLEQANQDIHALKRESFVRRYPKNKHEVFKKMVDEHQFS
jgi:hypothetical protein